MSARAESSKKSKTYHFHMEWEEDIFSLCHIQCVCSICQSEEGNVEQHFPIFPKNYDTSLRKAS